MSLVFKTCTPFIIINMGGEMLYILDQRLQAQQIAQDKATKVLCDVTQSLFTEDFFNSLFDPSPLVFIIVITFSQVSLAFCKSMFQKIAHCSIMKLNEISMGKLLDLMTMGIKYYLIASTNPSEIFHITLNHFNEILLLLKESLIVSIVENARNKFIAQYSKCTLLDFIYIRQNLLSFLQDKMVKISVFLSEGLQNNDGSIKILTAGSGAPFVEEPGNIYFFNQQGEVLKKTIIDIKSSKGFQKNAFISYLDPYLNYSKLGFNLYGKKKTVQQASIIQENQIINFDDINQTLTRITAKNSLLSSNIASQISQNQSKELSLLSSLLKGNENNEDDDEIVLDIGNVASTKVSNQLKSDSLNLYSDLSVSNVQQYQANKSTNLQNKMKEYFKDDDQDNKQNDNENDLLDLMDNL